MAYPISPLNGKAHGQGKHERSKRGIGEYLAELRRQDADESHGVASRPPQLVNRTGRSQGNEAPNAKARCPDQPRTRAPRSFRSNSLVTRDQGSPARSTREFAGTIRTPALRLGGAHGTERSLVGTYVGVSVRAKECRAPLTASFHLKLHERTTCAQLSSVAAARVEILYCTAKYCPCHSITVMLWSGGSSSPQIRS